MLLATWVFAFWKGRYRFAHIPAGGKAFLRETFSREGWLAIGRLALIFMFMIVFWGVVGPGAAANGWRRPKKMNLYSLSFGFNLALLASQIQADQRHQLIRRLHPIVPVL